MTEIQVGSIVETPASSWETGGVSLIGVYSGDIDDCGTEDESVRLEHVVKMRDGRAVEFFPAYGVLTAGLSVGQACDSLVPFYDYVRDCEYRANRELLEAEHAHRLAFALAESVADVLYAGTELEVQG